MNSTQLLAKQLQNWKDKQTGKTQQDATVQRLTEEIKSSKESNVVEPTKTEDGQELSVMDQLQAIEEKLNLNAAEFKRPKTSLDLFREALKK